MFKRRIGVVITMVFCLAWTGLIWTVGIDLVLHNTPLARGLALVVGLVWSGLIWLSALVVALGGKVSRPANRMTLAGLA